MSSTSISNIYSPTMKCCESESHIATILYSNNGCARNPWHMKNLKSPQLHNAMIVSWSFNATWYFNSCSRSFHSIILISFQQSSKISSQQLYKNHAFRDQHAWPLWIERFNVGFPLVPCIDDALLILLRCIEMQPLLVAFQHDHNILTVRCQRDLTMSGPHW